MTDSVIWVRDGKVKKMRLIDADSLKNEMVSDLANTMRMPEMHKGDMAMRVLNKIDEAPTIEAVPAVHYKDTNTTVLNVKSIEDWQDLIILDEGEESRSSAVYYADSDDMVRVVRCKDCRFAFQNNGHDKEGCPIMDRRAWMNGNSFCSEGKPMDKKEATK